MSYLADLHIHSRFSRATSKELNPASLDYWARRKGLRLIGTGDATHPKWLAELEAQLHPGREEGLFILNDRIETAPLRGTPPRSPECSDLDLSTRHSPGITSEPPRFVLSAEVSTIYKADGRTRKVHHLILLPDFKAAKAFQNGLKKAGGNISSDGRPILGLDSRDLFEILLEADPRSILIPAHIWTPWFSALGDKSGFNSIAECYRDLADRIGAVETGLSSNPPMNWSVSSLDPYVLISNSDAHSPENLGREATIFAGELSYAGIREALCPHEDTKPLRTSVAGTIEFFPEEGKYHYDGHRACGRLLSPAESIALGDICPVCGKRVTVGVLHRVMELADRPLEESRTWSAERDAGTNRHPFYPLVPLREILGELLGVGSTSKRVQNVYTELIEALANENKGELDLLLGSDPELGDRACAKIPELPAQLLKEALGRLKARRVLLSPGYDGEYGQVKLFAPGELDALDNQSFLFSGQDIRAADAEKLLGTELHQVPPLTPNANPALSPPPAASRSQVQSSQNAAIRLSPEQEAAASAGLGADSPGKPVLVIAGPGSGKTALLVERTARLIGQGTSPESILVLTFTNKAAAELRARLAQRLASAGTELKSKGPMVTASTFHAFGSLLESFLDSQSEMGTELSSESDMPASPQGDLFHSIDAFAAAEKSAPRFLINTDERTALLARAVQESALSPKLTDRLGQYIERRKRLLLRPGKFALCGESPEAGLIPLEEDADLDTSLDHGYEAYEHLLDRIGARDFDSLIMDPVLRLARSPVLLRETRQHWPWLLVDEYQDVNYSQYALVRLLSDCPFAIGDPDQAIYGFRGADPRFIERFVIDYPKAEVCRLRRSYRCRPTILEASGRLFDVERASISPGQSGNRSGDRAAIASAEVHTETTAAASAAIQDTELCLCRSELPSEAAESEWIARHIERLIGGTSLFSMDSGVVSSGSGATASPGDIAVLLRISAQAPAVEKALRDHGIPYRSLGERPWWETASLTPVLKALRIALEPRRALLYADADSDLQEENSGQLQRLAALIKAKAPSLDCVNAALEFFKTEPDSSECLKEAAAAQPDLCIFLNSLSGGLEEGQSSLREDRVSILTIHAAKGLEFPFVFIPGLEEGLIPFTLFDRSSTHLAEEARILYVAMTRAKQELFLSSAARRTLSGRPCEFPPSSFFEKMGTELITLVADPHDRKGKDPQLSLF